MLSELVDDLLVRHSGRRVGKPELVVERGHQRRQSLAFLAQRLGSPIVKHFRIVSTLARRYGRLLSSPVTRNFTRPPSTML